MPATPYDRIADWYDELVRTAWGDHEQTLPELGDLIGDIRGKEVCDLACGQGSITRWLAQPGGIVTGVDISERLLEIAIRARLAL